MFSLQIFADEMLVSQKSGQLTDYCLAHWDEALESFPDGREDMDILVEMASGINAIGRIDTFRVGNEPTLKYWQFVETLKASES